MTPQVPTTSSRQSHILLALTLMVGFIVLAGSFVSSYQGLGRSLGREALDHLRMEQELIDAHQSRLAWQVVEDNIRTPEVLSLVARAEATDSKAERDRLRNALHERLQPLYGRMLENGFFQLHFHLPGAVSFLRFHRPAMFGDSLWSVREGLRLAQTRQAPVSGFEEGRVVNGFRHVFPLEHEGRFVGTVEASFSFLGWLQYHAGKHQGLYRFLIRDDLVDRKVWPEEKQRNYGGAPRYPDFVSDRRVDPFEHPELMPDESWSRALVRQLDQAVADEAQRRMRRWEAFWVTTRDPAPVVISFLPVRSISGEPGGYILRYHHVPEIASDWRLLMWKLGIATALLLLVLAVLAVLFRRERRGERQRDQLLAELREGHQRLEEAQRIARTGNWSLDARSGRIHWSDEVYAIFGLARGDIEPTYERFIAFVHPEDRQAVDRAVSHAYRTGHPYEVEHRILRPDGQVRHVLERGVTEMDADQQPRRMIGTVQDISERRELEETRIEAAAIIESTREAVFVGDAEGRMVRWNASFQRETGLDDAELAVLSVDRLFRDPHKPSGDAFEVAWAAAAEQGYWEGELILESRKAPHPVLLSLTALTLPWGERRVVGLFTDISGIYAREQMMWHKAHHDPLTGAANRVLLHEHLNRAIVEADRHDEIVGLLYLDLDGFKPVNDRYGHEAGDQVLITLVERLVEETRDTDTVARLGGDEIAVMLLRPSSPDAVRQVVAKLRAAIERPVAWHEYHVTVSASIGVALFPENGRTADALLQAADAAMYAEKRRRREGSSSG